MTKQKTPWTRTWRWPSVCATTLLAAVIVGLPISIAAGILGVMVLCWFFPDVLE